MLPYHEVTKIIMDRIVSDKARVRVRIGFTSVDVRLGTVVQQPHIYFIETDERNVHGSFHLSRVSNVKFEQDTEGKPLYHIDVVPYPQIGSDATRSWEKNEANMNS